MLKTKIKSLLLDPKPNSIQITEPWEHDTLRSALYEVSQTLPGWQLRKSMGSFALYQELPRDFDSPYVLSKRMARIGIFAVDRYSQTPDAPLEMAALDLSLNWATEQKELPQPVMVPVPARVMPRVISSEA